MSDSGSPGTTPSGWYHGEGDPPNTERFWNGSAWDGEPRQVSTTAPPPPPPPLPAAPAAPQGSGPQPLGPTGMPGSGAAPPFVANNYPGQFSAGVAQVPEGVTLAELGPRVGARLIDWVCWVVIVAIIGGAFAFLGAILGIGSQFGLIAALLVGTFFPIIGAVYEMVAVGNGGKTLGKMALGIKVINLDGSTPGYGEAAKRASLLVGVFFVGMFLNIIPFLGVLMAGMLNLGLLIAGLVMISSDTLKQTLWDKVGGTIVITD